MRTSASRQNEGYLLNSVAIVTGGGTGIGLAAARALARQGAVAALFGPDLEILSSAVEALRNDGLNAFAIAGDVSESSSVRNIVKTVHERCGRVDILINSAAVQPYGTVETTTEAEWDRVLAVNLKGVYLMAHYCVPLMRVQGGGSIVNVASVQAIACQANVAAYVASKGAVLALTRAMALDHASDGIRVNSICPGTIDTPMVRQCAAENKGSATEDEVIRQWGLAHPVGRIGTPEEVGALIAFLCGPMAGFCTGAEYRVDGGLLAKLCVVDDLFGNGGRPLSRL